MCGIGCMCCAAPALGPGDVQGVDVQGMRTAICVSASRSSISSCCSLLYAAENRAAGGRVGMTCNHAILNGHKEND